MHILPAGHLEIALTLCEHSLPPSPGIQANIQSHPSPLQLSLVQMPKASPPQNLSRLGRELVATQGNKHLLN